ncbi:MAG TPA: aminoacyl-tRNA hydrolase, partial [Pyrinomonadaceae bacterium]|nr:aminoacyl-tRNA hydrolase [Pyrinomonadaceae bacterium]
MSARRLIVGLGNPGAEYAGTRHNLGFMLVDRLAREAGAREIKRRECRALVGNAAVEGEAVLLVKPQTYMNLSGDAVYCLLAKKEQCRPASEMIVISDDLALPFG